LVDVGRTTGADKYNFVEMIHSDGTKFMDIRGDGYVRFYQGGVNVVAGGATITAGGLTVSSTGQTITSRGLTVANNGITVADGGATVYEKGGVWDTLTVSVFDVNHGRNELVESLLLHVFPIPFLHFRRTKRQPHQIGAQCFV